MSMYWLKGAARAIRDFARNNEGGVATYFVLLMPIMIAVAGMSVDTAVWYTNKRGMQSAADAAAMGGAYEKVRRGKDKITEAALLEASLNGAVDTSLGGADEVKVNYPPENGERKGSGDSVEAIVTRQVHTLFSSIVFKGPITMTARAVAIADVSDTCVWALAPSGSGITVSGSSDTTFNCGLQTNSTDTQSVTTNGGGCITTTKIKSSGDIQGSCITGTTLINVPPAPDPFAGLDEPKYNLGCTKSGPTKVNGTTTINPGVYCGPITVNAGGILHFNDDPSDVYNGAYSGSDGFTYGQYILDKAAFTVQAGGTVTGSNISIFLTKNGGVADNVSFGTASINLSAAEDGPYVGILFWQSPNTTQNITHSFTGGSSMFLTGILYFPNQDIKFSGGNAFDATQSLLIAQSVDFAGGAYLGGFDGTPIEVNPLLVKATIVE